MTTTLGVFIGAVIALFIARLLLRNAIRAFKIIAFLIIVFAVVYVWFNKEQFLAFI